MNNEHKRLPTFGIRPPLPVGDGAPEGTRCIQLRIPDSDAAARQLLGVLRPLIFWKSYERDAAHKGRDWAEAWRAALAENIGNEECVLRTQLREDDSCTLSWSYDDWATFDSYDPTVCILANIDSVVPGMITQGILDAIADGTIQQFGGIGVPQPAPAPGTCNTYHVVLHAKDQWVCPSPVNPGDVITISNAKGGWCDGTIYWFCPTGDEYRLGQCVTGTGDPEPADPINTINHMRIIGKLLSSNVWFDPMTAPYTVPDGSTANQNIILQANDSVLTDNFGDVEFDVEVCTGVWCFEWDFTTGDGGFTAAGYGAYVAATGWRTTPYQYQGQWYYSMLVGKTPASNFRLLHWEVDVNTSALGGNDVVALLYHDTAYHVIGSTIPAVAGVHTYSQDVNVTIPNIYMNPNGRGQGPSTVTRLRLRGTGGSNPFGADNC